MNWTLALPEIVLAVSGLAILGIGVLPRQDTYFASCMATIGAFIVTAALVLGAPDGTAFGGQIASDAFTRFMKVFTLGGAALALLLSLEWNRAEGLARFEYPVLVLFATLGIAAFDRDNGRSAEAGLKYFVLGALASGLLLYGISLVYGFAGTTNFDRLADAMANPANVSAGVIVGMVFMIAGFTFKVAAVPFHMWTPDVYEGAPASVVAYFATATKVGAIAVIVRVMAGPFGSLADQWQQVLMLAALGSMLLGAFAALRQENIKRLMAYSWISHTGFVMMGLVAGGEAGLRGVIIYTPIYLIMSLGAFAVIVAMRRQGRAVERVSDLAGLARTDLGMAVWMGIFMFSMAGIPPLAGFFAKVFVFKAAIDAGLWTLAIVGVLASVVSAFYYLRIVKVMFFDEPAAALDVRPAGASFVMASTGLFNALFFVWPAPLVAAAQAAVVALLG